MGIEFDFSNFEKAIEDMSKKMQNKTLDKALDAGKAPVLKAMDRNVAVDTRELKGNLGEIKKQGSGAGRQSVLGVTSKDRNIVERAYYDEYGTECQSARHWMKKSFTQAKDEAEKAIVEVLKEELGL